MNVPHDPAWDYCERMLPLVSRTFALNISRLSGTLHKAVLIGYLLFRMADTLEDSPVLTEADKVLALKDFARLFRQPRAADRYVPRIRSMIEKMAGDSPEDDLMTHGDRVFECFSRLPEAHRDIIGAALEESAMGMAIYQERKMKSPGKIFQLTDEDDLTRYCYFVAGVVGKMLTNLFSLETSLAPILPILKRQQVHFGLALQMTNILKDYPKDLARGWCYLPRTLTTRLGVTLEALVSNPTSRRAGIITALTPTLLPYMDGAYRYIAALPVAQEDLRMFCIIPFVLAYHTLAHLARSGEEKLTRQKVQLLLKAAERFCRENAALKADYEDTWRRQATQNSS